MSTTGTSGLSAMAGALLDPFVPAPSGLKVPFGTDLSSRWAVHRNNVMHSLVGVLADTFVVVREFVGEEFFDAMACCFVRARPPTSPLMHRYGEGFPEWLQVFKPASSLPCLPDLARLELARWRALYAADAESVNPQRIARALQDPEKLLRTVLHFGPSLSVLRSDHPVVSLWASHQRDIETRDAQLASLNLTTTESAFVFRHADEVLVLSVDESLAALLGDLRRSRPLGSALEAHPSADMANLLGLLLRYGLVVDLTSCHTSSRGRTNT